MISIEGELEALEATFPDEITTTKMEGGSYSICITIRPEDFIDIQEGYVFIEIEFIVDELV